MLQKVRDPMPEEAVSAGPANRAAALHLKAKIREHDEFVEKGLKPGRKIGDLEIAIVEKGPFVGAHILSGAVMDPIAIQLSRERTSPRKTSRARPYAAIPAAQEISSSRTVRTC